MSEYDKDGALIRRGPNGQNFNELARNDGWGVVDELGVPFVIIRRKKNFKTELRGRNNA